MVEELGQQREVVVVVGLCIEIFRNSENILALDSRTHRLQVVAVVVEELDQQRVEVVPDQDLHLDPRCLRSLYAKMQNNFAPILKTKVIFLSVFCNNVSHYYQQ